MWEKEWPPPSPEARVPQRSVCHPVVVVDGAVCVLPIRDIPCLSSVASSRPSFPISPVLLNLDGIPSLWPNARYAEFISSGLLCDSAPTLSGEVKDEVNLKHDA